MTPHAVISFSVSLALAGFLGSAAYAAVPDGASSELPSIAGAGSTAATDAGGARDDSRAAAAHADSMEDADLQPTHDPPWVPREPVPAEQTWETVVRFPLRVATFP